MKRKDINLAHMERFCEVAMETYRGFNFNVDVMVAYLRAPRDEEFSPAGELQKATTASEEFQRLRRMVAAGSSETIKLLEN